LNRVLESGQPLTGHSGRQDNVSGVAE